MGRRLGILSRRPRGSYTDFLTVTAKWPGNVINYAKKKKKKKRSGNARIK